MTIKHQTKILICKDCGEEFGYTADAQEYNADKGWKDDPWRCKSCHIKYKKNKRQKEYNKG